MSLKITFLGGVGTVTGSKYLLESDGARILVDCGLFQGFKQLRLRNWAPPPVDVNRLDAVVLTHAHLDHSGYLPLLIKKGFEGHVYCTGGTRDLCSILLPDSGHLQEQDAAFANRHGFSRHRPALPLYTKEDAEAALTIFAPLLANWIRENVERPLLIGPDGESAQWVGAVAEAAAAPHVVLEKVRHGDRNVEISVPQVGQWRTHKPVLVDDIVSSGRTLIETLGHLQNGGMQPPVCLAVHGIFAGDAHRDLIAAGAAQIVTTNTVRHQSNAIDVAPLLAGAVRDAMGDV